MDHATTKREARRRKILENSEKRLQKITRVKYDESKNETDNQTDEEVRRTPVRYVKYVPSVKEDVPLEGSTENERLLDELNNASENDSTARTTVQDEDEKIWKKLGFKLVILAIIVRIVHIFKFGYLFGETVVIPFALFMMTQLGSCHFEQNTAGITGAILYFIGMSPIRIKNMLICYNVVSSILVYFGIYFFSFICAHLTCVKVFGL